MEKEMLVVAKLKEGMYEKLMGFMQSPEGLAERAKVAIVEKTIPGIKPDKSGVMFKVSVQNEEGMKEFVAGKNPIAKAIYEECVAGVHLYELSKVNV